MKEDKKRNLFYVVHPSGETQLLYCLFILHIYNFCTDFSMPIWTRGKHFSQLRHFSQSLPKAWFNF